MESIKGVGPARAYSLIKEHKCLEEAIKHLPEKIRENMPDDWKYRDARELFAKPDVRPGKEFDLKWELPDVEALVDFMVKEKGFK